MILAVTEDIPTIDSDFNRGDHLIQGRNVVLEVCSQGLVSEVPRVNVEGVLPIEEGLPVHVHRLEWVLRELLRAKSLGELSPEHGVDARVGHGHAPIASPS